MDRWQGRVALVTGASAGIGAAVCRALVGAGMKVVGAARSVERIQALADELSKDKGSLHAVKCDLTKDEDIFSLFEEIKKLYGGVDVCINNAGMSHNHSLLDGTPEEWRRMVDINVVALCLCTKLSVQSMRDRNVDDGHIINISSVAGHVIVNFGSAHFYTGTKHAVMALTEGLRQELRGAKSHIRASSISPGIVETEFAMNMTSDPNVANSIYKSLVPLQAVDIADSVLYVLGAPPHVEVNDVLVRPTEQSM